MNKSYYNLLQEEMSNFFKHYSYIDFSFRSCHLHSEISFIEKASLISIIAALLFSFYIYRR